MKISPGRPAANARDRAAFTLIELLAVMAIILVLAGLILNIAGNAQYNSAKSRANSEISALSVALESYKTDNGVYPPDPFTPDTSASPSSLLNAQKHFDPTNSLYTNNSEYLYQILAGYPTTIGTTPSTATTMSKTYFKFTPQQLKADSTNTGTPPDPSKYYIIDPFGYSYGYSTIYAATIAYNNAQNPPVTTPVMAGYNPTFDLWSTGGYAPGAKTTPSTNVGGGDAAVYSSLWMKNW